MLKIGEFSRLSRISIRMLRHYDEAGILKPQSVSRYGISFLWRTAASACL